MFYGLLIQLFSDFSSQIVLFLFDAFAELETSEANNFCILGFQEFRNGQIAIFNEFLIYEADFLVVFVDTAENHLFDDLFWFAFISRFDSQNFFFVFDFSLRYLSAVEVGRICCSDLHSDIFAEFSVCALHFDENADLASAVDVAVDSAFCTFIANKATNRNVFADLSYSFGDLIFDSLAVHFRSKQSFYVSRIHSDDLLCDTSSQCSEVIIAAYEVGFAVDFNDGADFAISGNSGNDSTFSSYTACFLRSLRQSLFTENIYCFFHIAFSFYECFFAVHHACASLCTQIFDHASGNCHLYDLHHKTVRCL
nr:MAG TPA: hypothetical protein [Caudoviricetes sp.]